MQSHLKGTNFRLMGFVSASCSFSYRVCRQTVPKLATILGNEAADDATGAYYRTVNGA